MCARAMEVNVVDPILRKGYRFEGTARIIHAGRELERILDFLHRAGRAIGPVAARVQPVPARRERLGAARPRGHAELRPTRHMSALKM